jgi:hypothetical protein
VATPASNPKRAIQFVCEPNQLQMPNNSWGIQHKIGIQKNSNKFFCSSKAARKRKQAEETEVSAASIHLPRAMCRTEKEISKLRMQSFERKKTRLRMAAPSHPVTR